MSFLCATNGATGNRCDKPSILLRGEGPTGAYRIDTTPAVLGPEGGQTHYRLRLSGRLGKEGGRLVTLVSQTPPEKRSRRLWIGVAVGLAVVVIVGVKLLLGSSTPDLSLSAQIDQALASGEATIFVFTWRGDCCEGTQALFRAYEQEVSSGVEASGTAIGLIWLDIALEDGESVRAIGDLAQRYGVEYAPSLLVVAGDGEGVWVKAGTVTAEEVRAGLAAALGG